MMSIALVLPPLTQLNTPYPSISYLANYFRKHDIECTQHDFGLELVLHVFSRAGLSDLFDEIEKLDAMPEPAWRALSLRRQYISTIEPTIAFLQGHDATLCSRILETSFLPAGPRIQQADLSAFGPMGASDAARHLATLYLADLADLIQACIDDGFALARYQANLSTSAQSFDPLWERLSKETLIDTILDNLCDTLDTDVVGLSVPFPGNFYAALRLGRRLKQRGVYVVLGGGYVNTELRDVDEPRLWNFVDAITYDDGEGPLHAILDHRQGGEDRRHRTRTRDEFHHAEVPRPATTFGAHYGDLDLGRYLQTIDTKNPAHRLWADGRWNKITIAHGCYWKKCAFCDVNLDYIGHYEAAPIAGLVDHIEETVNTTGQRGFHFVDEAAPPKLLRALAIELLRRDVRISMWGNIRFEKSFDDDLCRLLAAAGMIAITGGLEIADDRLLRRIDKGVTVDQVARAAAAFQSAGVMVHAYLMYGFPTQTVQETIDSMELVRQLFAEGLVNSAFWHRFVLTRHAPIFQRPGDFGIELHSLGTGAFARNDVPHEDPEGGEHDLFDDVLPAALDAWLEGKALTRQVHKWFPHPMPKASVPHNRIAEALQAPPKPKNRGQILWLGGEALEDDSGMTLHTANGETHIPGNPWEMEWLGQLLDMARPSEAPLQLRDAIDGFPGNWSEFASRWQTLRELGLLVI